MTRGRMPAMAGQAGSMARRLAGAGLLGGLAMTVVMILAMGAAGMGYATAGGVIAAGATGGAVVYAVMRRGLLPSVNPLMALVPQTAFFLARLLSGLVAGVVLVFRRRGMIGAPAPAGRG